MINTLHATIRMTILQKAWLNTVSETLLQTKLFVPGLLPSLIPRPHLIEKLNAGLAGRLTLVSAPAGFGKTTLISSWLREQNQPAAWLSLDEIDNEPAWFLRYFVAALERVTAVDPIFNELLQSEITPEPQLIFTHLLNSLAAQPHAFILVLEDFHVIGDSAIVDGLAFLIDHAPPGLHLVITSRADPILPLSRWRVRGQLNEIRAADLRFTQEETAVFLQHMGLTLTPEQAAGLETRTEGWAAGIQLAGLSLQEHTNPNLFIDSFTGSHHYVMDYLTDEVLSHQLPEIEAFLLQTSLLDRFCADLCDTLRLDDTDVIGNSPSVQILADLEAANLFLVALDDDRTWYRYHHLFADLLRDRLSQKLPADQIAALHRRAAHWLAAHNFVDEALPHAAAVDEWAAVSDAVARLAVPLFHQGRSRRVARWLDRIPDQVVYADPRLSVKRAWLLVFNLDWQGVGRYLETAVFPTDDPVYQAEADNIRAWHAITTEDSARGIAIASDALARLDGSYPAEYGELLSTLSQGQFAQGDFEKGVQTLETALIYLERGEHWAGLSGATAFLMRQYLQRGRLQQARHIGKRFIDRFGSQPMMQIGGGLQASAFYALTLYESGAVTEMEQAERLAARALELAELSMPNAEMGIWMRLFLALVKQMRGDEKNADALAEEAAAQLRLLPPHPALVDHYDLQIRYELLANHNARAQIWIDKIAALDLSLEHPAHIRNQIRQSQLQLQTASKDEEALKVAQQQLAAIADVSHPDFTLMKAHAVLALVNDVLDKSEAALASLEQAMVLAAPEKWIQMFVYPGERMARLLAQVQSQTAVPDFCARVLTAVQMMAGSGPETAVPNMVPGLLDPLTDRELEVLQLLAQGSSNREIANELFIAIGTTKRHIANIYSKMDVSNRTEAAVRARELGLLQ